MLVIGKKGFDSKRSVQRKESKKKGLTGKKSDHHHY